MTTFPQQHIRNFHTHKTRISNGALSLSHNTCWWWWWWWWNRPSTANEHAYLRQLTMFDSVAVATAAAAKLIEFWHRKSSQYRKSRVTFEWVDPGSSECALTTIKEPQTRDTEHTWNNTIEFRLWVGVLRNLILVLLLLRRWIVSSGE